MKRFEIDIDEYQAAWVSFPIRSKRDVITLWMKSIKAFSISMPLKTDLVAGKLVLEIGKMSRLFCMVGGGNKVFSISFPFTVRSDADGVRFSTASHDDVDSRVTSEILALVESQDILEAADVWTFADPLCDLCDRDVRIWGLFRDLILAEDGYVRYDYDPVRADGHIHPLHHLDVFYGGASTFKLGCSDFLHLPDIKDLLDLNTPSHYVTRLR